MKQRLAFGRIGCVGLGVALMAMSVACDGRSGQSSSPSAVSSGVAANAEAIASGTRVMKAFLAAFNARDEEAWADTLLFPHVRLAGGTVTVHPGRADFLAAMDLDAFARNSGWDHSEWDRVEPIQASENKVHFRVTFSRYRASGERMAAFDSLYVVERVAGAWGIRARSSFAP